MWASGVSTAGISKAKWSINSEQWEAKLEDISFKI